MPGKAKLTKRGKRAATRPRKKATVAEMLTIACRISAQVKRPYPDHGEDLYDEFGLPK